ncbi:MAG: hypothetical protein QXV83_04350, partial [Candidatus Anstonellaceae archaeon]
VFSDPENTSARTWQWYNGTSPISGATSQTWVVPQGYLGAQIKCQQTTKSNTWNSQASNDSSYVTILSSSPVIVSNLAFTNASAGHWFFANATVADADGANDIAGWFWNISSGSCVNHSNSTSGENLTIVLNCSGTALVLAQLNLTIFDYDNNSVSTFGENVYPNNPAVVENVTLSPSVVYVTTPYVNCTPSNYYDLDNDTISFYYNWFVNGTLLEDQVNSNLSNSSFSKNSSIICQVTPFDGYQNGTPINSSSVVVSNSLPQVQNISVLTNIQMENTYCYAEIIDPDGQEDISEILFTIIAPNGTTIINSAEGIQINSTYWRSPYFNLTLWGVWNCSIYVKDKSNSSVQIDYTFNVIKEWQKYYGATLGNLILGSGISNFLINWSATHGKTIYVAEPTTNITFSQIYPLGRCVNGSLHSNDFTLADSALGINPLTSRTIQQLFDSNNDGIADNTDWFSVFGRTVDSVPVAKISPSSAFSTGIFWQASESSQCYSGIEDLIFAVKINESAIGTYGVSDYEIMIPMELATYKDPSNNLVAFYGEYRGQD